MRQTIISKLFIAFLWCTYLFIIPAPCHAQTDDASRVATQEDLTASYMKEAMQAFSQKDYMQAATSYQHVLKANEAAIKADRIEHGELSDVYYNLANCYYKLKKNPQAVLAYQRSILYNPANKDARFNLELTQTKLADRFDAPTEMFFVSWLRTITQSYDASFWIFCSFLLLSLCMIFCLTYRFSSIMMLRKVAFSMSLATFFIAIYTGVNGIIQNRAFNNCSLVVVMQKLQSYGSPSTTSAKMRILNEGTTVKVINADAPQWLEVEMPDGKTTWIQKKHLDYVKVN